MNRKTAERYERALAAHRAGDVAKAEALYLAVLDREPRHADTLHLLGALRLARGRTAEAVDLMSRAVAFAPRAADFRADLALALHDLGRLEEAEGHARAATRLDPGHAGARHNLGLILAARGRDETALESYILAVGLSPDNALSRFALAETLRRLGRVEESIPHFVRAAELTPGDTAALANLSVALRALGRAGEAVGILRPLLARRPNDVRALVNLAGALLDDDRAGEALDVLDRAPTGLLAASGDLLNCRGAALRALGRKDEALVVFREAVRVDPGQVDALDALGDLEAERGDRLGALRRLQAAVAARPDSPRGWNNFANALSGIGLDPAARAAWRRAVALAPDSAESWSNIGNDARDREAFDEAVRAQLRSVRLGGGSAALWSNLGHCLDGAGDRSAASRAWRVSAALDPARGETLSNVALGVQRDGDRASARRWFDRALTIDPGLSRARFNRGLLRLEGGDLAGGWPDYAHRFASGRVGLGRSPVVPAWRGEDPAGRRILVWREQGIGDEILFSSMVPELAARGARVIFECDRRLVPLFARSFPGVEVRAERFDPKSARETGSAPDYDLHVPIGSLSRVFRSRLADFLPSPAWLVPDPARVSKTRRTLDRLGPGLRVGVAWTSGVVTAERRSAYVPLTEWGVIAALPGIHLVNLQYGDRDDEIGEAEERLGVSIFRVSGLDLRDDLEGAAALSAAVDLVICPTVSAGELAGAVGTPVWRVCALDWTTLGTGTRPWFPAGRVWSPSTGEGLSDVLARVARELRRLARQVKSDRTP